jgi:hypothetical protein
MKTASELFLQDFETLIKKYSNDIDNFLNFDFIKLLPTYMTKQNIDFKFFSEYLFKNFIKFKFIRNYSYTILNQCANDSEYFKNFELIEDVVALEKPVFIKDDVKPSTQHIKTYKFVFAIDDHYEYDFEIVSKDTNGRIRYEFNIKSKNFTSDLKITYRNRNENCEDNFYFCSTNDKINIVDFYAISLLMQKLEIYSADFDY